MQTRFADLAVYALIVAGGIVVIWQNAALPEAFGGDVGPAFFPSAIAWIMVGMCAIGMVQSLRRGGADRLAFPGLFKIGVTIVAVAAYILVWQMVGYFYPLTFAVLSGLLLFYGADGPLTKPYVIGSLAGSAAFAAAIYVFFNYVLYVKF